MQVSTDIFIITSDWQDAGNRHILQYFGVCRDGNPVEIIIDTEKPVFFVPHDAPLPAFPFPVQQRPLQLSSFDRKVVDGLYFRTQRECRKAEQILKSAGIPTYEADIRTDRRYLMERFIYAQVSVSGIAESSGRRLRFHNPKLTPCQVTPKLVVASIDIETGVDSGRLYSIAMHISGNTIELKKVLMVSSKPLDSPDYLEFCPDERTMLLRFFELFRQSDPDIIIGWNVIGFDLSFLENKCREHGLSLDIARSKTPVHIRRRQKSGLMAIDISGRAVLDGPPMLRSIFYSFVDYSLETVSQTLLNRGKQLSTEVDKIREIDRMFAEDKVALAAYNLEDCVLVTEIFQKLGLIELQIRRSQITGLLLKDVGISTAEFDHIYLPRLHRRGFVAPNKSDVQQMEHTAGGYVMDPVIGIHEHVILLDFKSLYPSLMQTFHIEPLSKILNDVNPLVTPSGHQFSRTEHFMESVISDLMERRAAAKKAGDAYLQHAIKILMNSFYGVMGSDASRFYDPVLPTAVTKTARWLLIGSKNFLEEKGYQVLYGDTDSLFVKIPPEKMSDPEILGNELAAELNTYWQSRVAEMSLKSYMEIEFEKYYRKFVLPMARGKTGGARKRYAGLRILQSAEKLEFVGMEYVRTDWTPLAKDFQYELYWRVLKELPVTQWLREYLRDLRSGKKNELLIYHKRLRKHADEYTKNATPQVRAARILMAEKLFRDVRTVRYVMSRHGAVPVETGPHDIDYMHYIQKQLRPIADSLLILQGKSFEELCQDAQLSLFDDQDFEI